MLKQHGRTLVDMGVGSVNAAAMVATSRTVKSAKLAAGTLAAPPTTPNSFVSAWSFAMDPGMLMAVVHTKRAQVSERAISSASVEIEFAARSVASIQSVHNRRWSRGRGIRE